MSMSLQERYYHKYEYLAKYYADKIWNTNNIGMEKEDVVQEFKLKLFTAIKMYGKKRAEYKRTGRYKPVPIEFYLKSSLLAQSTDFIKSINRMRMVPMSSINFDHGADQVISLDADKSEFVIDGFDILDLFKPQERKMLKFHIKGMDKDKISKIFKNSKLDPNVANEINMKYLKGYLIENATPTREFVVSHYED